MIFSGSLSWPLEPALLTLRLTASLFAPRSPQRRMSGMQDVARKTSRVPVEWWLGVA